MDNDDKPFKEETIGTKVFIVSALSVLVIGSIAFVFGAYYFGMLGLFSLLGIEYESLYYLFLFAIFYFLLSIVGDLVIMAILKLSTFVFPNIPALLVKIVINILVAWSIISFLNFFMKSIDISIGTQLIAASIIGLIGVVLEDDDK